MKAIVVMFDSLNRHYLPPYGCDWVHAPNFTRLAERAVTFNKCYAGSLPCMPARREMHTGRYNFLHRSWGPIEPFDDSAPEILKRNGVYTHLVSDHPHYWEDGGLTYHTQYNTWDFPRGSEGDPWIGEVADPVIENTIGRMGEIRRQDVINRKYMQNEEDHPQMKTFRSGLEFIRTNRAEDNWFLQIESFAPHEPFFSHQRFKDLYPHEYDGPEFDWPDYKRVTETEDQVRHCQLEYAAVVSMCDENLGKVLDIMDELNLWEDTMLIVNTDHGYLLGEHGWWAKNIMPLYSEIARIPLFIWDPRAKASNERREALVQTIDLAPTLLDYFHTEITPDMQGKPLAETVRSDQPVREAALFGIHGAQLNCTDGRYVYMRSPAKPDNTPLCNYTLMPTNLRGFFSRAELQNTSLAEPFSFTKGMKTLKVHRRKNIISTTKIGNLDISDDELYKYGNLLFDLQNDPKQEHPIVDKGIEARMIGHMVRLMRENDAPEEQYERLGLQ